MERAEPMLASQIEGPDICQAATIETRMGRDLLARVETSVGTLDVLTEVTLIERKLVLSRLHVYGVNVDPNALGLVRVRHLVQEIVEDLDVDEITIEGAVRVTGAGPGRTVHPEGFA